MACKDEHYLVNLAVVNKRWRQNWKAGFTNPSLTTFE